MVVQCSMLDEPAAANNLPRETRLARWMQVRVLAAQPRSLGGTCPKRKFLVYTGSVLFCALTAAVANALTAATVCSSRSEAVLQHQNVQLQLWSFENC